MQNCFKYQDWAEGSQMWETTFSGMTFISFLSFRFWYFARFSNHPSSMPNWKSIVSPPSSMLTILNRVRETLTPTRSTFLLSRLLKLIGGIFMLYPGPKTTSWQSLSSDLSEQSAIWSHLNK